MPKAGVAAVPIICWNMPCRSVRDTCELLTAGPDEVARLQRIRMESEVASMRQHASAAVMVAG